LIDLTDIEGPVLRLSAWMTGSGPDSMKIQFSSNAGISYTTVMSITSTGGEWDELSFNLTDYVPLNNVFQLRVQVTDAGADTTVEGGIDGFKVSSEVCDDARCSADMNGDGVLDFFDVSEFLSAFNAMDAAGDFNGDGNHDFFDVSEFLAAFTAGCP
ncbi:MAG TPA: hypothetical protein DF699_11890, partial [Phycisphaerales bacterium]|nr:hypothetical protein [Phycisphaerales bacterium]